MLALKIFLFYILVPVIVFIVSVKFHLSGGLEISVSGVEVTVSFCQLSCEVSHSAGFLSQSDYAHVCSFIVCFGEFSFQPFVNFFLNGKLNMHISNSTFMEFLLLCSTQSAVEIDGSKIFVRKPNLWQLFILISLLFNGAVFTLRPQTPTPLEKKKSDS